MPSRRRPSGRRAALNLAGVVLALALGAVPAGARKAPVPIPQPRPAPQTAAGAQSHAASNDGIDMSRAVPLKSLLKRPSTADQLKTLKGEIAKDQPLVTTAKSASEALALEAEALRQKLVATAARVEALESEKAQLDAEIARLSAENDRLSHDFARDRVSVSRLLAVLERLQHDLPPAMAVRPDDALSAARGAMLIGASLPEVYGQAADLSRRLDALRRTRADLVNRRAEAARNSARLAEARLELDQLLALKRLEASAAATRYGDLKKRLDIIASQAGDLEALLQRVAQLRAISASVGVLTVTAENTATRKPRGASLLCPVVGVETPGGMEGVGGRSAPGTTFATAPAAQVISPADGRILFAGPYQKSGQVLILEMADGYDAVLAGLDRLDVRPEDRVLAGEPVGSMSKSNREPRLYFELRQNGRGMNPAPCTAIVSRKARRS